MVLAIRSTLFAMMLLVLQHQSTETNAFVSRSNNNHAKISSAIQMCPAGGDSDDPTKVWYAGLANSIQNVLTNSPLNEGKKALVKGLAGDYDQTAIRAQLDSLITSNKVLMLSFVK